MSHESRVPTDASEPPQPQSSQAQGDGVKGVCEDVVLVIDEYLANSSHSSESVKPYPYPRKTHSQMPQASGPSTYDIYFVNRGDTPRTVVYSTGGWCSDDDGITKTSVTEHRLAVAARSVVRIEQADEGTFDYTFWYDAAITAAGGDPYRALFAASRHSRGPQDGWEHDPVLGKEVRVIRGRAK